MSWGGLFGLFLRFGLSAFGGPVAQIAMIRRELVERQEWISGEGFNRLLAVLQALPGPEAHELCVHLGVRAKGRLGGLLAGLGFMLPGFVVMLGLAWLYFAVGAHGPGLAAAFLGAQIAVLALIVRAGERIGRHILTAPWLWAVAGAACAASLAWAGPAASEAPGLMRPGPGAAPAWALFLSGLKAGLLTFGGAYTAIPFVRADVVPRGWVADGTFLDGVALAQAVPAPLIMFGTFVGYAAGGFPGALAMTAGVFLPAFGFSMVFYDRLEAIVRMKALHVLLDGVAAAVVGLIVATTLELGLVTARAAPSPWIAAGLFAPALAAAWLWNSRLAAPVVIAVAALAGFVLLRGG